MKLFPEQEPVHEAASYEDTRRTGFTENWSGALGLAINEDLPVISRMVSTTVEAQRNQKIGEYTKSGEITPSIAAFYDGDADGLAGYARDVLGLEGFVTDKEYQEQVQLEYKGHRDFSKDTFAQQSGIGMLGELAGYAHAMVLDPIYATSMLTGYGSAATIGQAALRVGVMEAGIEAVAQGPKMAWKDEIASEYSGAEAVAQVAFAGLGSAALAGLGKGVSRMLTPKDLTVGEATKVIERLAKDNPEMEPVLNTLRHSDPEENLVKALEADEAIDIRRADEGPLVGRDPKSAPEVKVQEIESAEEAIFMQRQPVQPDVDEGVPRGTPEHEKLKKAIHEGQIVPDEDAQRFMDTEFELKGAYSNIIEADHVRVEGQALPKVPEGYTRLFRASSPTIGFEDVFKTEGLEVFKPKQAGAHYTRSMEYAEMYKEMYGPDAVIDYVDAPTASLDKLPSMMEAGTFVIDVRKPGSLAEGEKVMEGVPRGTPTEVPDTRHPLVKEADDMVVKFDEHIKTMEECF